MARVELEPLPPDEAVAFFRRKFDLTGFDWRDVSQQEHAAAFTVAKAMRLDILADIRSAVDEAIAGGMTFPQFRERLEPLLRAKGWWGRQPEIDPQTGERRMVQLGSPRRLRIIYQTNLRTALSAGRWERAQRVKALRPYLRYAAVLDTRTRPQHRDWHGTVLPVDHPWWKTHYPPNGWNCRCIVMQLSERDLARNGWKVGDAPEVRTRPWRNRRTGETIDVPEGIDPGFGYNVGRAAARVPGEVLIEKVDAVRPDLARAAVADVVRSRAFSDVTAGRLHTPVPVGVLAEELAERLGAGGVQAVRFSEYTAAKQLREHPDLAPADYARLQDMIDRGTVVLEDPRSLNLIHFDGGRWWYAALKSTLDGRELYLSTYHRLQPRQARRRRLRGRLLREGTPASG